MSKVFKDEIAIKYEELYKRDKVSIELEEQISRLSKSINEELFNIVVSHKFG